MTDTTFNPSDAQTGITLSGGNLVATWATGSITACVRTFDSCVSGKFYFEYTFTTMTANLGCGLATKAFTPVGAAGTGSAIVNEAGNIFINSWSSSLGSIGAVASGGVVCVAVDIVNQLIWFRNNGGNWNGSGTANPATGVGGLSIAALSPATTALYGVAYAYQTSGGVITANFGASGFAQAVPSGFTSGLPVNAPGFNRVSTLYAEIVGSGQPANRVSTLYAEAITSGHPVNRVSTLYAEVIAAPNAPPPPGPTGPQRAFVMA